MDVASATGLTIPKNQNPAKNILVKTGKGAKSKDLKNDYPKQEECPERKRCLKALNH